MGEKRASITLRYEKQNHPQVNRWVEASVMIPSSVAWMERWFLEHRIEHLMKHRINCK